MAKIDRVLVGEALAGEGNEIAHVELIMGPRGSAAEAAFCNALTNQKNGFNSLIAVITPECAVKPSTLTFNKVTIKNEAQANLMFGAAQRAAAMAVADSVQDGTIPMEEADDVFISIGVFVHWKAKDANKVQDYNYEAIKKALKRAVNREPKAKDVVAQKDKLEHPYAAHK